VLLYVDSPGGTVDGTQALADLIFNARGKKPIVAIADGMAASAAYWIGSAADKFFISGDTTLTGSIGVVAQHTDISTAEEKRGIKVTEITAGKYKRIASEHAPLTDEGRASIQERVDHLYSVFVDNVARNRGVSSDLVASDMADGKLFVGKQAIKAGLVDGVSTPEAAIASLAAKYDSKRIGAVALAAKNHIEGGPHMDPKEKENVVALTPEIRAKIAPELDAMKLESKNAGSAKARKRSGSAFRGSRKSRRRCRDTMISFAR
jgi:signal peptide peptidase SppA